MDMKKISILCFALLLSAPHYALAAGSGGASSSPYVEITPPFVVNLDEEDSIRFLQVNAQIKLTSVEHASELHHHLPAIRHAMVMLLSSHSTAQIKTLKGKEDLRQQAVQELNKVMEENTGVASIKAVYFTGFIIQ